MTIYSRDFGSDFRSQFFSLKQEDLANLKLIVLPTIEEYVDQLQNNILKGKIISYRDYNQRGKLKELEQIMKGHLFAFLTEDRPLMDKKVKVLNRETEKLKKASKEVPLKVEKVSETSKSQTKSEQGVDKKFTEETTEAPESAAEKNESPTRAEETTGSLTRPESSGRGETKKIFAGRGLNLPEEYAREFAKYRGTGKITIVDEEDSSKTEEVQSDQVNSLDEASYTALVDEIHVVFQNAQLKEDAKIKKEGTGGDEEKGFTRSAARPSTQVLGEDNKGLSRPKLDRRASEELVEKSSVEEKHRREKAAKTRKADKEREREQVKTDEFKREIRKKESQSVDKKVESKKNKF